MQLIIECDMNAFDKDLIQKHSSIKYLLPDLGFVVVEVPDSDVNLLTGLPGVLAVHSTAQVSAQSAAARSDDRPKEPSIAFLDTGISPVKDFGGRILAFKDFVNGREEPYDDNGHGTHVAGIAAGNGAASFGKYIGICPSCNIVAVKILNGRGKGSTSEFLAGIQWVIINKDKYNIRVMNVSVGADPFDAAPLEKAAGIAWDRGIVVCAAAGNSGPEESSVTAPGTNRKVITVGTYDDDNAVSIWGNSLVNFSGRGPTAECIVKPDIVAPGANIVSVMADTRSLVPGRLKELYIVLPGYVRMSGTSMSTPIVSAAVALLLRKHPELTPNQVKYMLAKSAKDLGYPKNRQGFGALDINSLLGRV